MRDVLQRTFRDISIRRKLTAIIMLTSGIVLVLASGAIITNELITFRRSMVEDLATLADVIGTNSTAALTFEDPEHAEETLEALRAAPHIVFAQILTRDGRVFATYAKDKAEADYASRDLLRWHKQIWDGNLESSLTASESHHFGDDYLDLSRRVVLDGELIVTAYLRSDMQELYDFFKWYAGIVAVIMLVSASVAYLLSSGLQRVISKPILGLAETMKIVSNEKAYSIRADKQSNDEVGILIDGFNEMLTQIQIRDEELERRQEKLEEQVVELQLRDKELKHYAAELRRSNKDLEQFAYIASHDLQEPLRMVSSYTQLLARRYKGRLDSDADEFIGYAVDGVGRMQELINSLLTYSRVGTKGKSPERTDCKAVFDQTYRNLQKTVEDAGAKVTCDPLPTVMADDIQLGQLFQNLISNAIKFRGKEPPRIHVSAKQEEEEWVFSVRDNGIGIDSEYAERIFVMFQRLHGMREYPGTGIGLAICKKIVERHGGRIWVESRLGEGTIFYFTMQAGEEGNHD